MDWQTIRTLYPSRWLVVQAIDAYTEGAQRIIPELVVIETFGDDWHPAWERFKELHAIHPYHEYYVLHTDRLELDIGVIDAFGRVVGD